MVTTELLICLLPSEHPLDRSVFSIASLLPSGHLAFERRPVADAAIQTLPAERGDLDLGHVPPADVLRGVVEGHAPQQVVRGLRAQRLEATGDSANGIVGLALANGLKFTTGTIEVDLRGKDGWGRSFLGVAFNVAGEKAFEGVYFRPFNFKADEPFRGRAVQYIAWPTHTWEKLRRERTGKFEAPIKPLPDPNGWFHVRVEVAKDRVRVFVDRALEPCLTTTRLAQAHGQAVGLFVDSADGMYANLRITPDR